MEAIYWLLLCVLLIGVELATMGLTTIWFAAGAFAAFIAANLGGNLFIQLLILIAVSVILLIFTRPLAVKYLNSRTVKTNVESLVGRSAVVTEDIDNLQNKGLASINGQIWTARSIDDHIGYVQGEQVDIVEIRGNKLIVRKHIQEVQV
ncbi:MAG: NfeD family protein [Lachnospiraceae bacterium]